MKFHLWTIIPAIIFITSIYWGLGINGYWNYSQQDFINGNLIVFVGIGMIYLGEKTRNHFKNKSMKLDG